MPACSISIRGEGVMNKNVGGLGREKTHTSSRFEVSQATLDGLSRQSNVVWLWSP